MYLHSGPEAKSRHRTSKQTDRFAAWSKAQKEFGGKLLSQEKSKIPSLSPETHKKMKGALAAKRATDKAMGRKPEK
jgi:hypothetical protein